jgi:hypothetical protein
VFLLTVTLFGVFTWISTNYAPPVDCYERATWNGQTFEYTGEWICLK